MNRPRAIAALILFLALVLPGAGLNPNEEFSLILKWEKPANYPPPILAGMKTETLSLLLDSGNLQWYEPRPEEEKWEAVVGMKIHAPAQTMWEVITDYPALCRIMPKTYLACATEWRKGRQVKNNQQGQTTVLRFAYKYDIIDMVDEDPPYHLHVKTIEGLKDRELDMIIVPIDDHTCLFFMRYHLNMAALGYSMQAVLAVLPSVEPPTAAGAANYHARAYKNEAEARAGSKAPPQPAPLAYDQIAADLDTLAAITRRSGGLIRETPEGKTLDAVAYTIIDAPPATVYEVITDFDHYSDVLGGECTVESREGNTVIMTNKTASFSVLIFSFGYEIHAAYHLDPPYHLSYQAIDGTYLGSYGDFRLVPIKGGQQTLAFHQARIDQTHDDSLTAEISRSGAFPLENMLNMMGAQGSLAHVRVEAEKRAGKGG